MSSRTNPYHLTAVGGLSHSPPDRAFNTRILFAHSFLCVSILFDLSILASWFIFLSANCLPSPMLEVLSERSQDGILTFEEARLIPEMPGT